MTDLMRLVSGWLGGEDPVQWIRARRDAGRNWDLVAVDLYDATGRKRWIPPETLRGWERNAPPPERTETGQT